MLDKKLRDTMELLGGKAVIKEGEEYFVLMNLREFKKMKQEGVLGLTKQELVDKINNDIASWKFSMEENRINKIDLEEIGEIKEDEVHYEKA
jgi:hypothetical protein